ncbi:MAG: TerC family protein, partial [Gemmatimonadaceae bacterium]
MQQWFTDPSVWLGLITLTALEIVLGIDNIIFISILASKVREEERGKARTLGLIGAFVTRLGLLFSIAWLVTLTRPLFTVSGAGFSGRDVILIAGGMFLIGKATREIHGRIEGGDEHATPAGPAAALSTVVAQIMGIDIVFSLDSVITAVGMVDRVSVMIGANVIALCIMLFAAGPISGYVDRHPTVKMLA